MKFAFQITGPAFVAVLGVVVFAAWSQEPATQPHTSQPAPEKPADFQNLESIFSLISSDLPPEVAQTRFPNNDEELQRLAKIYESTAEHGDRIAEFKIGAMYLEGVGVRPNYGNAARWFTKAGGDDHPLTQLARGMFCLQCRDDHDDGRVREAAIRALGKIGPAAEQAVPLLEQEVRTDGRLAFVAVEALGQIGEKGVPLLIEVLTENDPLLRRWAALGLAKAGEAAQPAIPALTAALKDEDSSVRRFAQSALKKLQQPPEPKKTESPAKAPRPANDKLRATLDELVGSLRDSSPEARAAAAIKLRNLRENAKPAVPALIVALHDSEAKVRECAAEALGWIGPGDVDAVPALIKALRDPSGKVRSNAARAFITDWPGAERALPALINALGDREAEINASYAVADLAKHGHSEAVVSAIQEYLKRAGEQGKWAAVYALGQIGPAARVAVPALKPLLSSQDASLRQTVAEALVKIDHADGEAVQTLVADLHQDESLIRADAARSLGEIGPAASAAVPELMLLLADYNQQAFQAFWKAAEQGVAEAQFQLALCYRDGLGTPQDAGQAANWFRKAATQQHAAAQRQLGILYRQGRGVPQSDAVAEDWYRKAADTDSVLSRLKDLPLNTAAYEAAMIPHRKGVSDNAANQHRPTLILAVTSFQDGATSAFHHQVQADRTVDSYLDIYDHARRGGSPYPYRLSTLEMDRLTALLKKLPAGVQFVPLEQKLVVSCRVDGQWTTRSYDNECLPQSVRSVLDVLDASVGTHPFPPQEKATLPAQSKPTTGLIYDPTGVLLSWGRERKVYHWQNGELAAVDDFNHGKWRGRPLAVSPDGSRVVTSENGQHVLWNLKTAERIADLGNTGDPQDSADGVVFCADGQTLAIPGFVRHRVDIWDARTGAKRGVIDPGRYFDRAIALSGDGAQLALSCEDGVTRIWDLATSKVKDEFPDFQSPSLAFAPNGAALAGMRQDDLIVWDLPRHTKRFQIHVGSWAGLISFSKDGSLLACKRQQRMIKLWDARDGRTCGIAEGHSGGITALAFSPDGKEIATSSDDGTIKLWNVDQLCAEK